MKRVILFCLLVAAGNCAVANHLMGGYLQYRYVGPGGAANTSKYQVTVFLYINCITGPGVPTEDAAVLGVFDASGDTSVLIQKLPPIHQGGGAFSKTVFDRCITTPPAVCYLVYPYSGTVELPNNAHGYTLAVLNIYRTAGIINVQHSGSEGLMNVATIPGTINGVDYHTASSPAFIFHDTVVICHNNPFVYKFNAEDPDGDTLTYAFGSGVSGYGYGLPGPSGAEAPPYEPPYPFISYTAGFSGTSPLGPGVTINPATGVISGTAPDKPGAYEVVVYVSKWRNGIVVTTLKKELQITVADCGLAGAQLKPEYINCDNYSFTFQSESTSSGVTSYLWTFGAPGDGRDSSTQPQPTYTYTDTGIYKLKLVVYNKIGCADSASATVKVYPGFKPGFTVDGDCYQAAFKFTDTSYAKYGSVNSWRWDFGDAVSITGDTSILQNPGWLYSAPGTKTVTLLATSTKGCSDFAYKTINVRDQPAIYLAFKDTLICSNDTLPLFAQSSGSIVGWVPRYNINDKSIANPSVYPTDTTVYTVTVNDKGCIGSATVTVNVLPYITVSLMPDTAICKTDSIALTPTSYALNYSWAESNNISTLSSTGVKYPKAAPGITTTYNVTANLGHCQANAKQIVYVSPYPAITISSDTGICYGNSVRLYATTTAAYYTWAPVNTLGQPGTLTPLAQPQATTTYLLTVRDTLYCPKTVTDSVTVRVVKPFSVNAGRDTTVVINQPLQLLATSTTDIGGVGYVWSPASYLSNPFIYNPVASFTATAPDSITYLVTAATPEGCYASDYITVKLYKTAPEIFVPGAFTPNGDGANDIIKPILAGITEFHYFRVFNRFGQCVFQTSRPGDGWDGSLKGEKQPPGTYVFMAHGKDYLGNVIARKGTIVLIR